MQLRKNKIVSSIEFHSFFMRKGKSHRKAHAFTLIELVVVITILAILGTIGFLSVGGFSSRARDSGRAADVAQVSKSLDLSIIAVGDYPAPDQFFTVTYSGGAVWHQGTVGNGVIQKLHTSISGGGLDSRPTDPLNGAEFTYSKLAFGKAYQIKATYEGDAGLAMPWVPTAFAAPGNPTTAYIKGNYGGLTAKTVTGSTTYVLAVPSIVTGSGIAPGALVEISGNALSGTLQFNGKNLTGASSFNPNTVVFSGSSLPLNDASGQITAMMGALKTAYSGSDIATVSSVSTLLNTPTGGLASLGSTLLTSQLGGTVSTESTPVATQSNPTGLSLSHSSRSRNFTFSWTAGSGNGASCKLQYYRNGGVWTDISGTTYNCDANLSGQSVTLPADGWYSGNWNTVQIRIIRTSNSAALGTFGQSLNCTTVGGSASSTPTIDEDCNGSWNNTTSVSTCNTCTHGGYLYELVYYTDSSCTNVWAYDGTSCYSTNQFGNKGCGPQDGKYSTWSTGGYGSCTLTDDDCGACGTASTTYTYY